MAHVAERFRAGYHGWDESQGKWTPFIQKQGPIETYRALFVCPNGHPFALIPSDRTDPSTPPGLQGHTVAEDGTVTPKVTCPEKGCGFSEDVKLEAWFPGP